MPEFFNVLSVDAAYRVLLEHLSPRVEHESVESAGALGRITAREILSPEDLPSFPRSTMDGFSVRAADTFGATEGLPAYLEVVGEVAMGAPSQLSIGPGQAAQAYTGGALAAAADAVVMVENTQVLDGSTIEVVRPAAPGENVVQIGEDVRKGDTVLPRGHVLRPQDIGGLLALGIVGIPVARRPRVAVISTGDELVPPDQTPGVGQVRDINTYTIASLVTQSGGDPVRVPLLRDDYEAQRGAAQEALRSSDILVFSAGSSVSSRDMTASVIDSLGDPGLLVHGISFKPGKPAIVALVDDKPVFGLPGNPVSAVGVFDLLVRPAIYLLGGCPEPPMPPMVHARLLRDVPSVPGREDQVQVKLVEDNGQLSAQPVFGKSNLIYTLVRADGSLTVPLDRGGLYAGDTVRVRLF